MKDAGKEEFAGLRDGYYLGANIVFIFSGGEGNKTPAEWEKDVKRVVPNVQVHYIDDQCASIKNVLG